MEEEISISNLLESFDEKRIDKKNSNKFSNLIKNNNISDNNKNKINTLRQSYESNNSSVGGGYVPAFTGTIGNTKVKNIYYIIVYRKKIMKMIYCLIY